MCGFNCLFHKTGDKIHPVGVTLATECLDVRKKLIFQDYPHEG